MWHIIKEHSKAVWNGFVGGTVVSGSFLYVNADFATLGIYLLLLFKAVICGGITALVSAFAADIYKHKLKHLFFKKKKDGDNKENKEEKAA